MIHIAICTESPNGFSLLVHSIERYRAKRTSSKFGFRVFSCESMEKELKRGLNISVVFFDNDSLPGYGLPLARKIRDYHPEAVILFASSSKSLAFDAFALHAQRYLLLPLKQKVT